MMSNPVRHVTDELKKRILDAAAAALLAGELKSDEFGIPDVSSPKEKGHGDMAANFAMQWAKIQGMAPRQIAEAVCARIEKGGLIEEIEIAGPGFVNFTLGSEYYSDALCDIERSGSGFGRGDTLSGEKIMVEFVSANPTGPMHMGNARGGVLGDTLASVFEWCGAGVTREFYINDAGNQVHMLTLSLESRYLELFLGSDAPEVPENGYHGEDIVEKARTLAEIHGDKYVYAPEEERREVFTEYALRDNIARMQADLKKYGIEFDVWFAESSLHESGYVDETMELLKKRGALYEKDGAIWFKASEYGCEKDEVIKKSNGFYTYYAVDLAYHRDKFEKRRFDRVIDVLGADHHGHVLRYKAGLRAMGLDADKLEVVLMQLVRLMSEGEVVRMSKRTGKVITLAELLEEIPVDAARFFFNFQKSDSAMDFDLDLAAKRDSDNPVYYVQYAHARICSIMRAQAEGGVSPKPAGECNLSLLVQPEERELAKLLITLPEEVELAARQLDPSRITRYAATVAAAFHKFYNACRVAVEDEELMHARLKLCELTKQIIKNSLDILKIEAPERM